jgi:transcriptional regulatory protein LevR
MSKLQEHLLSHEVSLLPCEYASCDKKFRDEYTRKKHLEEVHNPDTDVIFDCPTGCGYSSHVPRFVEDHLRKKHRQIVMSASLKPRS